MIDLHCHLLFDLDDGARDREESEKILKRSAEQGVGGIVASSHAGMDDEALYESRFQEMQLLAQQYSITLFRGREHSPSFLLNHAHPITLGESRFLLLDCGMLPVDQALLNRMTFLRTEKYKILLAHPERLWIGRSLASVDLFSQLFPVAVQINAGSLLGRYGKKEKQEAWKLLEAGKCHVIASDAHHAGNCRLAECREYLSRFFPEKLLQLWFEENPARILADQMPLPVVPEKKNAWKRAFFRLWS